ncbi:MAG: hypothetical protein AAFR74_04290, partial [Pseudomonadota bacterium]
PSRSPTAQTDSPLTSLIEAQDATETIISPPSAPEQSELRQAQAIEALKRLDCNRMAKERPLDCPQEDPFVKREIEQARQQSEITLSNLNSFGPSNAFEAWQANNSGFQPTSIFGEDNSIFIDPMAAGAYNAQRIRNGENPIWDRDIERDLRDARGRD